MVPAWMPGQLESCFFRCVWLAEQICLRELFPHVCLASWNHVTLRADRLKSNYLGCWIFEISSLPDLVNFSIFFFVFLNICPLEFDKFHLVFAFWVARGLGTLRSTRLWIYIWVFKKLHLIIWLKILKVFIKKWLFPNLSRINLGWSLDHQSMKKHHSGSIGSFRNHEKTSKFWK